MAEMGARREKRGFEGRGRGPESLPAGGSDHFFQFRSRESREQLSRTLRSSRFLPRNARDSVVACGHAISTARRGSGGDHIFGGIRFCFHSIALVVDGSGGGRGIVVLGPSSLRLQFRRHRQGRQLPEVGLRPRHRLSSSGMDPRGQRGASHRLRAPQGARAKQLRGGGGDERRRRPRGRRRRRRRRGPFEGPHGLPGRAGDEAAAEARGAGEDQGAELGQGEEVIGGGGDRDA